MKLIPEQIKYLRARKQELENKKREYLEYCENRETGGLDTIGAPHYLDFQEEANMNNARTELKEIEEYLATAEFVSDRNTDQIDIGTLFYVDFGDDDIDKTMLVDKSISAMGSFIYSSVESDLGKAVLGKKEGDIVTYEVSAIGRKITIKIKSIDKIRENYEHFIKETDYTYRMSDPVRDELKELKEKDPTEYIKRHSITRSQEELLLEELSKIKPTAKDPVSISRRGHINKILNDSEVVDTPTGDTIQVGSIVELLLKDGENEKTLKFEMINRAVSTEIESDYVERISTLGSTIYGLKANDTFKVRRNHKPSINGIVLSVENEDVKKRVK